MSLCLGPRGLSNEWKPIDSYGCISEIKARARMEMEEKYLAAPNVIGVIVGR